MGRMLARVTSEASDQGEQAAKLPTSPESLHYPHRQCDYKGGGRNGKTSFFMPFIHIKDIFFSFDFVCSFFQC